MIQINGVNEIVLTLIPFLLLVIVVSAFAAILKRKPNKSYKYERRRNFLSKNELNFYNALRPIAARKGVIVFTKVRLADIIEPKKNTKNWRAAFNKVAYKHVDFLLCEKTNLELLLAIELDDSSHDRLDRQERDKFVDQAFKSAGLPVLHTRSADKLETKISEALEKKKGIR